MGEEKSTTVMAVLATEGASLTGVSLSESAFDGATESLRSKIGTRLLMDLPVTIEQVQKTERKVVEGPILREVMVEGEKGERRLVAKLEYEPSIEMGSLISDNRFFIGYTPPAGPLSLPSSSTSKLASQEKPWNTCPACDELADLPEFEQPGTRFKCCHCGEILYADYFGDDDWRLLLASDVDGPESEEGDEEEPSPSPQELRIEFGREGEELYDGIENERTIMTPEFFDSMVESQRQFIGQPINAQSTETNDVLRGPILKDVVVEVENGVRVAFAIVEIDNETDPKFVKMVASADDAS